MSDSRLEKFIYAICSMDVTDLPVPLSRIEKLWNCLITGETPDFEPLSRNEKYLMAMLDRYDISNLPAPMSRGEKLLYKIAVGETDLSDVPGYYSRYEELLKYLIENGGISGGDFEYVLYTINQSLYTLYTTSEKPVKSAILTGQTLVNLSPTRNKVLSRLDGYSPSIALPINMFKSNVYYIAFMDIGNVENATSTLHFQWKDNGQQKFNAIANDASTVANTKVAFKFKQTLENPTVLILTINAANPRDCKIEINNFMVMEYQDGMENWDIPYFEGMTSVKMPVLTTTDKSPTIIPFDVLENAEFKNVGGFTSIPLPYELVDVKCIIKIREDYPHNIKFQIGDIEFTDAGDTLIKGKEYVKYIPAMNDIKIYNWADITNGRGKEPFLNALKVGSISITLLKDGCKLYPYYGNDIKTNILTVNEDVELRGVGNVKDELNLLTGELTQRVGESVCKGDDTEYWFYSGDVSDDLIEFARSVSDVNTVIACDRLPISGTTERFVYASKKFYVRLLKSRLATQDIDGFKKWLASNPITVQYQLATESIKTVDLTVVDQDNQPTRLGTFKNITHVSLESAGLIPEVEMEVATRISKELASASPLMDDISMKQEQLNTTIDEQSNNVDATMIATTEIFEETL